MNFQKYIRHIPDFPKPGIKFADITPLLRAPEAMRAMCDCLARGFNHGGVDVVAAAEARGFLFGVPVAERLGAAFVPIRKPGKLPYKTITQEYQKEYGPDKLAMHVDAIKPGDRVLLVDDLLATGGSMEAMIKLIEKAGGKIMGIRFAIELGYLDGRRRLGGLPVESVVVYNTVEGQK